MVLVAAHQSVQHEKFDVHVQKLSVDGNLPLTRNSGRDLKNFPTSGDFTPASLQAEDSLPKQRSCASRTFFLSWISRGMWRRVNLFRYNLEGPIVQGWATDSLQQKVPTSKLFTPSTTRSSLSWDTTSHLVQS